MSDSVLFLLWAGFFAIWSALTDRTFKNSMAYLSDQTEIVRVREMQDIAKVMPSGWDRKISIGMMVVHVIVWVCLLLYGYKIALQIG